MEILTLENVGSTNEFAQEMLLRQQPENGFLVRAVAQTAGKGQKGNSWESEAGKNITCSVVLYPRIEPRRQFSVSQAVAMAVLDTLDALADGFCVKWPNDIYYKEKKIAGILIEMNLSGKKIDSCVAGIGLNVNQTAFVSDAPNPVSLAQITHKEHNLDELTAALQRKIAERCRAAETDSDRLHAEYKSRLFRKDGFFSYKDENGTFVARIRDIAEDGHLLLETPDGETRSYAFKEVTFVQ